MRLTAVVVAALSVAVLAFAHDPNPDGVPEPTIQSLEWLSGDWISVDPDDELAQPSFTINETWSAPLHDSITGVSKTIAGAPGGERTVATRVMTISPRADNLLVLRMRVFDPLLADRGEARVQMYPLHSWTESSLLFENHAEDHPRRVMIERTAPDSIRITSVGLNAAGHLHAQPTDFRARQMAPAADPRIARVQLFLALINAGEFDAARAMMSPDPKVWRESDEENESTPWVIGPGGEGGGEGEGGGKDAGTWDEHFSARAEALFWHASGASASLTSRERSDFDRLLERGWTTTRATYFFDDEHRITSLLTETLTTPSPGRTDEFLAWAQVNRAKDFRTIVPSGEASLSSLRDVTGGGGDGGDGGVGGGKPECLRRLLNAWRREVGLAPIHP